VAECTGKLTRVTPFEPQRIVFTPFALSDASELFQIRGDEDAMRYWDWPADGSLADTERIAQQMAGAQGPLGVAQARAMVADRMMGRLGFVGSSERTKPLIEASFRRVLGLLDRHLAARPYLMGSRPALADFGLWGQLYEAATDPTPGGKMRASAPHVVAWVQRMLEPKTEGPFESWSALGATLRPLLSEEVGGLFLPWSVANATAIAEAAKSFDVLLGDATWTQEPQKYHARSLGELRRKYQAAKNAPGLAAILTETGCLPFLEG